MILRPALLLLLTLSVVFAQTEAEPPPAPTPASDPCAAPAPARGVGLFASRQRLEALEQQSACAQAQLIQLREQRSADQQQISAMAGDIDALRAQLASNEEALLQLSLLELTFAELEKGAGPEGLEGLNARVAALEKDKKPIVPSRQVIYHFWATTCGPCVQELPQFVARANGLDSSKVRVRFVAEENDKSESKAREMFSNAGGRGALEIAPASGSSLRGALHVSRTDQPVTVLATASGRMRMAKSGTMNEADWTRLSQCLDQPQEELRCR